MINPVLTYLHDFYGDGQFHDLTPLIRQNPSEISETYIHNLHLDGFIEIQEASAFKGSDNPEHVHPIFGRMTEKGMYYLEGNQKAAVIIRAIENQSVLSILYRTDKGHEEQVALSPYIYGKDSEERAWVWGAAAAADDDDTADRRFLLDQITLTDKPLSTFTIDKEMMLSQPRDIEVVAQVQY